MCLSSSICRSMEQFCRGTSGFRKVSSSCRSFPLQASILHYWLPFPSMCAGGGDFACWAVSLLQTVLVTSYLTPPCYLSHPDVTQLPHHLLQLGHLLQVLHLCSSAACPAQKKGLGTSCSLRSSLQPLPSTASSGWRHWPPTAPTTGVDGAAPSPSCNLCSQKSTILPCGSGRMSALGLCLVAELCGLQVSPVGQWNVPPSNILWETHLQV